MHQISSSPEPSKTAPEEASSDGGATVDPLLLDADAISELARQAVVRRGYDYFKENRVKEIDFEKGERLWAEVEGSQPDRPYLLEIWADEDKEVCVECDCPYDWEPACKHAVAALLAYAARQPIPGPVIESAADEAISERARRGRSGVRVKLVDGERWCGTWQARSMSGAGGTYTVELRAVGHRLNTCTCPDFATNRLGTCKHIHAVEHKLRKRGPRKYERLAARGIDRPLVHVDWQGPDAPVLRLRTPTAASVPEAAACWFSTETGAFLGRLPEDERVLDELRDMGIRVGCDVEAFIRQRAADDARAQRSARIAARLERAGSHVPGVDATLYSYQVQGVAFLAGHGRALLADDMGLGKTLQAIAAARLLQEEEAVRRSLVICPASLKHQWAREIERFTEQDAVVIQGRREERLGLYGLHAPFSVVNYELVLRDQEAIQRRLAPDLLILDEAQRIKNWRTKTAAAVKALDTRFAFVLTGTPLENRLEDLYSLMQVVDPRVLGPLWSFMLEFHVLDSAGRVLGYRNLSELRRRLRPVMLRRDRREVADQLPARIDHRLDVDLDEAQRNIHDSAVTAATRIAAIQRRRPLTPSEERRMMAALQRARMVCDAASLVDDEADSGSPKLRELHELLGDLCVDGDHKVVIFTEWERMSRQAARVARSLDLEVIRLHGGVPSDKRGALIERFHSDPLARVFISTDAGSTGLNLQCASALVNLDLPWNPAVLDQRIGRIHRLGQTSQVQIFILVALDSYEQRVAGLVAGKRKLFTNSIEPDGLEDAVGLSRRAVDLLEVGLEDEEGEDEQERFRNAGRDADPTPEGPPGEAPLLAADAPEPPPIEGKDHELPEPTPVGVAGREDLEDAELVRLIARLQGLFSDRIERVVARRGGLVTVLDQTDAQDHALVEVLTEETPIVLLDTRSWAALCRLEPALGDAPRLEGKAENSALRTSRPRRKLAAARVLLDNGMAQDALELSVDALLASIPGAPSSHDEVACWLYGTGLPSGRVTAEQAALATQAIAIARSSRPPPALVAEVLEQIGSVRRVVSKAAPEAGESTHEARSVRDAAGEDAAATLR